MNSNSESNDTNGGRPVLKVASMRQVAFDAQSAAEKADNDWQAELDKCGIDRYSKAAKGKEGSTLRGLYESKVAAVEAMHEAIATVRRYQDTRQAGLE